MKCDKTGKVIVSLKDETGRLPCQRITEGKDVMFPKIKMGRFCFRGLKWESCLALEGQNGKVMLLLKDKIM